MTRMESFLSKRRKKNVVVLPVGTTIPKEKLRRILRNYDVCIQETGSVTDASVAAKGNHDDDSVGNHGNSTLTATGRDKKTMKKRRTVLFIPSFRKSKKTSNTTNDNNSSECVRDSDRLSDPVKPSDNDSGKDSDSLGSASPSDCSSIRSSSSSLTSSVDSGVDLAAPRTDAMLPDTTRPVPILVGGSRRGRAPIASPEDDSLLHSISEEAETASLLSVADDTPASRDNVTTLVIESDSSCDSCDSDCDISDKPSPYCSDSDSDLASSRYHSNKVVDSVSSDSDSDFDLDQCSDIFSKCSVSSSQVNLSNSSIVHKKIVNSGRMLKSIFTRRRIKTNGSVKHMKKSSQPSESNSGCKPSSFSASSSEYPGKRFSDFLLTNETSLRTAESVSFRQRDSTTASHSGSLQSSMPNVRRSQSLRERPRPSRIRQSSPTSQQRPRSPPSLQVRSSKSLPNHTLDSSIPDICANTNKTPSEVRQSLQKTAFWVENNSYDRQADPSSVPAPSTALSQRDLCNEIIGVYFGGDDDDTDSSLSSSFLDNDSSLTPDHSPASPGLLSPPRTLETNIDDFSVATFLPAPYPTAEAKTRKIANAKIEKPMSSGNQQRGSSKPPATRPLTSASHPVSSKVPTQASKTDGAVFCCDNKPVSYLSEQEVDNITKLHTLCNGQRIVQYLNMSESPMLHFPPPKTASRISWHQQLVDFDLDPHSPRHTPTKPKSALRQRPEDFQFPYTEDKPSPIVVTRLRRSKSLSRSREWPW